MNGISVLIGDPGLTSPCHSEFMVGDITGDPQDGPSLAVELSTSVKRLPPQLLELYGANFCCCKLSTVSYPVSHGSRVKQGSAKQRRV